MSLRFNPIAFMIAYSAAYMAAYWFNLPLFVYYPLHGEFAPGLHPLAADHGPGMAWYGFVADAAILAGIAGVVVPDAKLDRLLKGWLWLFPCVSAAICLYLLRVWFLQG